METPTSPPEELATKDRAVDSTPTNWFELAVELCASGHITETRMRLAIEAVRQGVARV